MPYSDHRQYSVVVDAVLRRDPLRVLDIGVGYGTYGTLLRAHIPDMELYGVEPHKQYEYAPGHNNRWWAYDRIYYTTWPDHLAPVPPVVDVALMVDVVEHYADTDAATNALLLLQGNARAVVIATPKDALRFADTNHPNPHEQHRLQVTLDWLATQPMWRLAEAHDLPDSWVVVLEDAL